jgi:hypothetical protein
MLAQNGDVKMTPLDYITERVNRNGDVNEMDTPRPLLTLTEFFSGNDFVGSIGCNLIPTPTPFEFYRFFETLLDRPDVADVRVQVTMFDTPEWPFSDTVWVITSAAPDEVARWFPEETRPDECSVGWTEGMTFEPYVLPEGMHPVACWWD